MTSKFVSGFLMAASLLFVTDAKAGPMTSGPNSSVAWADAPALSAPAAHKVGFRRATMGGVVDLATGNSARDLGLALWYPASPLPKANEVLACYKIAMQSAGGSIPAGLPARFGDCGTATENAKPNITKKLPVIILSHGLNGWATGWSQLAENLASKGYVVIAIDHQDRDAIAPGGLNRSFGESVLRRSVDQRTVLSALARLGDGTANGLPDWMVALADGGQVALVGYSMGGFGAITTAGAGLSPTGSLAALMPAKAIAPLLAGNPGFEAAKPTNLRSIVLFAPFGGAMPLRAWSETALSSITLPTLMISGEEDDVIDHRNGVRWIFSSMTGAKRHLLTYQNARHNIAMNPTPSQVSHLFVYRERFDEPVWRSDRLQAINAHMLTAFLGTTIKNDKNMATFLSMPTELAVDGTWPLQPGQSVGATTAKPDQQASYWPGFQRRWAVGLTFETKEAEIR
jgi:predicted dienelactone hydrolase